jgi:hypothetical protein
VMRVEWNRIDVEGKRNHSRKRRRNLGGTEVRGGDRHKSNAGKKVR